ncbi:lyase family protein [Thermospira aquatica]|uniref:Fumarate lyase n=1 Tax=Thermospira aquatica TaxID=2828656 RepID=A0AAX3BBQ8_9SPIR|nr:lyase family protein [Thermospira aquatica]URA09551.1 fumarate lyase [Thermospira aquatica]
MKYGKQTELALQNFGRGRVPEKLIRAYGEVKKAAILAIQKTERFFPPEVYESLLAAIEELISGKWNEECVIPLQQGGAGTSFHMNINEIIASRATEILHQTYNIQRNLHPLEDVNRYQSTNDTFPTAVTIVLFRDLLRIEEMVIALQATLVQKEKTYSLIPIMGRTELQDALPMTLGQVFGGWAGMIERDRWRLHKLKDRVRVVALGGTAVGTGFPAPQEYVFAVEQYLRDVTGLPLARSQNLPDAIAHHDDWSELASGYLLLARNLEKLCNDLLLYTSSFLQEMTHPEIQYGSTIMAAKTNPVLLEWVKGMCMRAAALCRLVEDYHAAGNLQLNAFVPFIAEAMLEIADLLQRSLEGMIRFLEIVVVNTDTMARHIDHSRAMLNLFLPVVGYEKTKAIAQKMPSFSNLEDLKRWLAENGFPEDLQNLCDISSLTRFIRKIPKEKKP